MVGVTHRAYEGDADFNPSNLLYESLGFTEVFDYSRGDATSIA
ncbi:MAG: hypothetical protein QNJ75_09750 [Acidimicrobiia bacterium]|nr:hypothetical protein [Acidimicrobiia bacterium]